MKIDATITAQSIPQGALEGRTAVVIDVLRATSTITTALASGCHAVFPVLTIKEARETVELLAGGRGAGASAVRGGTAGRRGACGTHSPLLGGERLARRIEGFDLGNSPSEYTPEAVSGRVIIHTTTNGTRALRAAAGSTRVLAGCFLNAEAVAGAAAGFGEDVLLACAGTRGCFSADDTACAGLIAGLILELFPGRVVLSSTVEVALELYRSRRGRLIELLGEIRSGGYLKELGLYEDIEFCSRINHFQVVPILNDGAMLALERIAVPG
ncbi:MAG: 2-phosphosulfolactate phosphatase [Firmicutes bacterium]|nr:2-phosphosulfolactate phosphatase [Bacillota bacterium]